MDIELKAWLYDIMNAIAEIEDFFADRIIYRVLQRSAYQKSC